MFCTEVERGKRMSNHNNDDFMNYVGYQMYGGGNDPAFRPMPTSNAPRLNINPKSFAFFIIMMAISMFAQAVGDIALYENFFAVFFISHGIFISTFRPFIKYLIFTFFLNLVSIIDIPKSYLYLYC